MTIARFALLQTSACFLSIVPTLPYRRDITSYASAAKTNAPSEKKQEKSEKKENGKQSDSYTQNKETATGSVTRNASMNASVSGRASVNTNGITSITDETMMVIEITIELTLVVSESMKRTITEADIVTTLAILIEMTLRSSALMTMDGQQYGTRRVTITVELSLLLFL